MEWQLVRFNPRRNARKAPAAEVRVDGELLWMTVRDIKNNIRDFGDHPELQKALQAYRANVEYPARESNV
jgi:hypothetical protein